MALKISLSYLDSYDLNEGIQPKKRVVRKALRLQDQLRRMEVEAENLTRAMENASDELAGCILNMTPKENADYERALDNG